VEQIGPVGNFSSIEKDGREWDSPGGGELEKQEQIFAI